MKLEKNKGNGILDRGYKRRTENKENQAVKEILSFSFWQIL
jgi:hypothetical protein